MAYTTEKSYTQTNANNRDFTVTFPFLDTADIRVQKNQVTQTLTTHYTVVKSSGSTVVNFNTAPANGDTIRLFRDTDIDDMEATFVAGSAIRSGDLNTNNLQLLYAAQEFGTLKDDNSVSFSLGNKGDIQINSSSDWIINPNSIELAMMTDDSVGTNELVDESVTADKLANFAITDSELATNSVTNAKIATDAVTTVKIQNNAISTAKIQAGAVTPDKLSTSANSGFGFVPVGAVFWFGSQNKPVGYLECNGDSVPNGTGTVQGITADFSALYAIVSGTIPDLRGEFIRGFDNGRGVDNGRGIRTAQSSQNKQHTHSNSTSSSVTDPGHTHSYLKSDNQTDASQLPWPESNNDGIYVSTQTGTAGTGISVSTTVNIGNEGGSDARPRNVALLACIKY